jgi:hypothetical protein
MATIQTYTSRIGTFNSERDGDSTNGCNVSPSIQYTADGTAISVDFESNQSSTPYYERVTIHVSAEGAPKTTVRQATWTFLNNGSTGYSDYTFNTSSGTQLASFALDASDNIIVPLIGTGSAGTTAGAIYFVKFTKPSEGWRAWALNGVSSISSSISSAFNTIGYNGSTAYAYGLKGVWHTASGHIVVLTYQNSTPNNLWLFYTFNASTFAYVSSNGFGGSTTTGNSLISGVQFGRNSQSGGVWWNQGTTTTTDLAKIQIWNVSTAGVITSANRGKLFGITLDTYSAGLRYVGRISSVYYGNNKLVSIARSSASGQYYLRVDSISQTSTSISSLQSDSTYASTPGGSYSSGGASTVALQLQPFYEEGFVRIWAFNESSLGIGYLDAYIDISTNAITFDTTSYDAGFGMTGYIGYAYPNFSVPTFNRHTDFILPSIGSTTSTFESNLYNLPTGKSWANATTGPTAASFTSPTVTSLNLQGGLKFQITYTGTSGGHGFAWYGRSFHQSAPFGYQLKRTLSGTDTYYNTTTQTFGASPVTNTSTASSVTVDIPASAGFATSGVYAFSVAIVDANGIASPFGTTDSITSTTATATTTPTATRFIRKTLANVTLSHEYTFNNRALVNKINVANAGNGASTIAVQVGEFYLVAPVNLPAGATLTVDTSQVVDANDRLMLTSSNSSTDVYISGTEGI